MGKLNLSVPQVRDAEELFRSYRFDKASMAEIYIQGVCTRKVTKILEAMCGLQVSSTQVSRVTANACGHLTRVRTSMAKSSVELVL